MPSGATLPVSTTAFDGSSAVPSAHSVSTGHLYSFHIGSGVSCILPSDFSTARSTRGAAQTATDAKPAGASVRVVDTVTRNLFAVVGTNAAKIGACGAKPTPGPWLYRLYGILQMRFHSPPVSASTTISPLPFPLARTISADCASNGSGEASSTTSGLSFAASSGASFAARFSSRPSSPFGTGYAIAQTSRMSFCGAYSNFGAGKTTPSDGPSTTTTLETTLRIAISGFTQGPPD